MEPNATKEAPQEWEDLSLPEDSSLESEESLVLEGDDLSLPEPPTLEEMDLELAQGSALKEKAEDFSLETEILSSEEMPQEEPEIQEIEQMLGDSENKRVEESLDDVVLVSEKEELAPPSEEDFSLDLEKEELVSTEPEISFEEAMEGAPSKEEFFSQGESDEDILFSDEELDLLSSPTQSEEPPVEDNVVAEVPTESPIEAKDFFEETQEDEPVTLSQEELEGILQDATTEEVSVASTEVEPVDLPVGGEEVTDVLGEAPQEDEEISLSQEELEGILEDAEIVDEAPPENFEATPLAEEPSAQDFFADADEEPITLTEEELGGILEDSVPAEEVQDFPEIEEKSQETAPVEPLGPEVTLTENLEKGSLDLAGQRADAILEKAQGKMPDREELRKMIAYLDNLLGELPDEVILRFAQSEYYQLYQKVMEALEL